MGATVNGGNFFIYVHSHILLSMRQVLILAFSVYFRNDSIKISKHIGAIQGKGIWCHIYDNSLAHEKGAKDSQICHWYLKQVREVFSLLLEVKGRFLMSRPSSTYDAVRDSICGHWITFTALSNYPLHIHSCNFITVFRAVMIEHVWTLSTSHGYAQWHLSSGLKRELILQQALLKRKIPDLLKKTVRVLSLGLVQGMV